MAIRTHVDIDSAAVLMAVAEGARYSSSGVQEGARKDRHLVGIVRSTN